MTGALVPVPSDAKHCANAGYSFILNSRTKQNRSDLFQLRHHLLDRFLVMLQIEIENDKINPF